MNKKTAFVFLLFVCAIFLVSESNVRFVASQGSPSLSASPTTVVSGQSVTASWSNLDSTGNDWISLHPVNTPDSSYMAWQYSNGSSGSDTFQAPSQPGWYEFRLFRNGERVATSNPFEVVSQDQQQPTAVPPSQPDQPPTQPPVQQPPYARAQLPPGGIHFGIYCTDRYGTGESNNGSDPHTWGCGGNVLDHNQVCRDIWGDARPYAHYGNGLGSLTCESSPQGASGGAPLYPQAQTGDGGIHTLIYCKAIGYDTAQHSDSGADIAYSHRCVRNQDVYYIDFNRACFEVYGDARRYAGLDNSNDLGGWKCYSTAHYIDPQHGINPNPTTPPQNPPTATPTRKYFYGSSTAPNGSYVYVPQGIDSLKLRTDSGTNYASLGYVVQNQYYTFLEARLGWVKIRTSDRTEGWVASQYVQVSYVSTDPPAVPPNNTNTVDCNNVPHHARYDNHGELNWANKYGIEHVHYLRVDVENAQNLPGFEIWFDGTRMYLDAAGGGQGYTDFYIQTRWAALHSAISPYWFDDSAWKVKYSC